LRHTWVDDVWRALAVAALAQLSITGPGCNSNSKSGVPAARTPTAAPPDPAAIPAIRIDAGKEPVLFYLQLAVTPEERANGLVGRPTLAVDAGLLFVFDAPGMHAISMKDTLIPIDLVFISADRRIVGIVENTEPSSATERQIAGASQYVLEIRAGLSSQHGFKVGQSVSFQGVPAR
jgi:uncharacterized membrane protein (UPF0127 family)